MDAVEDGFERGGGTVEGGGILDRPTKLGGWPNWLACGLLGTGVNKDEEDNMFASAGLVSTGLNAVFANEGANELNGFTGWSKKDPALKRLSLILLILLSETLDCFVSNILGTSLISVEGVRLWIGWKWLAVGGRTVSCWKLDNDDKLNASFIRIFLFCDLSLFFLIED